MEGEGPAPMYIYAAAADEPEESILLGWINDEGFVAHDNTTGIRRLGFPVNEAGKFPHRDITC
jgi:hypothetical protein